MFIYSIKEEVMQKRILVLVQLLVFVFAFIAINSIGIASEEAASVTGPAEMELQTAAAKKPAKFPHRKHQESFECGECHHAKTDNGVKDPYVEGMEIKKCASCHNKDDMSNPKLNHFKLVAHALCKECHKKNKDSAPTKCSGCHIKK
jgi:hypothetical protein